VRGDRGGGQAPPKPARQQARATLARTNPHASDSADAARRAKVAAIVAARRQRATDSAEAARQARRPAPAASRRARSSYPAGSGLAAEAARQARPTRPPGLNAQDLATLHGAHFLGAGREFGLNALRQLPHLPQQFGAFALSAAIGAGTDVAHPVRVGEAAAKDLWNFDPLHPGAPELQRHSRFARGTVLPVYAQLRYMVTPGPVVIGQDQQGLIYRGTNGQPTRDVAQARHGIADKMVERPWDYALLARGVRDASVGGAFKAGRALERRGALPGDRFTRGLEPGEFAYRTRTGEQATVETSGNPAVRRSQVKRRGYVVAATGQAERLLDRELPIGEHARATRILARQQRRQEFAERQRALGPFDRAFKKLKPHESIAVVLRAIGGSGPDAMRPSELLSFVRERQAEDASTLEQARHKLTQPGLSETAKRGLGADVRRLSGALKDHERIQRYIARVPDELAASVDTTPHLRDALEQARSLSTKGGDILEAAGKVSPQARDLRPYLPARIVRGARFEQVRPSPALEQARAHVGRLERAVETATGKRDRELEKLVARVAKRERVPHTEETAAARLAELEGKHETYLRAVEQKLMSRPVAPDEARQLLAEHDAKIAEAERLGQPQRVSTLRRERRQFEEAQRTGHLVTRFDAAETGRRNLLRSHGLHLPTQREELRQEVLRRLEESVAQNPEHPTWQRYKQVVDEIERLHSGLNRLREERIAGRELPPAARAALLGHQEAPPPGVIGRSMVVPMVRGGYLRPRGQAQLDRLSSALSVARDRAQALEARHVERYGAAPEKAEAGFVGGPEAEGLIRELGDVVYFPHRGAKLREGARPQAHAGLVPPKAPDAAKLNRGVRLLASRWLPSPIAWRDSFVQALGYAHARSRGELAFRVGERVGPNGERHEGWYYVRSSAAKPTRAAQERSALEREAADFLGEADPDLEGFVHDRIASRDSESFKRWLGEGTPLEDVRQISPADYKRLFGEFRPASEFVRRFYDRPTDFWRALTLNYRPAWVVNNLVGQTLLYALHHSGPAGAKAYALAALNEAHVGKSERYFPEELRAGFIKTESATRSRAPAGVGQIDRGVTSSLAHVRDLHGLYDVARAVGQVESHIRQRVNDINSALSDNVPRRAAWYRVVGQHREWLNRQLDAQHTFDQLLTELEKAANDPTHGDVRLRELHDRLVQQVHNQLVDFNDLSEFERRVMRRVVPFYSWVKGINKALGHFAYHHPLKTLLMVEGGRANQQQLERVLGASASILENVVPIGHAVDRGHGPEQDVLSTAGLNPLQTVADIAGKGEGFFRRTPESPADNPVLLANPIIQAIGEALYRKDAFRGSDLSTRGGAAGIVASQLATSFPEAVVAERLFSRQYPTTKQGKPHLTVPGASLHGVPFEAANFLGLPIKRKNLDAAQAVATSKGGHASGADSDYRKALAESARFAHAVVPGRRIPPEIQRLLLWKRDLTRAKDATKAKLRVSKLPAQDAARLTAQQFVRLFPAARAEVMADLARLPQNDDARKEFAAELEREALQGLDDWNREKNDWLHAHPKPAAATR